MTALSSSKARPSGRRRCRAGTSRAPRSAARRAGRSAGQAARRRSCWRRPSGAARPTRWRWRSRWRRRGRRLGPRPAHAALRVRLGARRPRHQRLHVQHARQRADAAVADQVPQLGAQRGGGLLDHRHRLHGGEQFAVAPTRAALRPACSKRRRSARPTRRPVLLAGFDVPAVRRAGLGDDQPRACWPWRWCSHRRAPSARWPPSTGRSRAAGRLCGARDPRPRAPWPANAMADALPLFEALARGTPERARPAAVGHAVAAAAARPQG